MRIVVIGGTGLIGSKLVAKLDEHEHDAIRPRPREVPTDPAADYCGITVAERTHVPVDGARLGDTGLDDWLQLEAADDGRGAVRWAKMDSMTEGGQR